MGIIYKGKVSVGIAVHGCPQSCKHCWLGPQNHGHLTFDDAVDRFHAIKTEQRREPHYGDDYRQEYAITDEINQTMFDIDRDFSLVSLWRVNRDDSYAKWCKERGINRAQLKVFGGRAANNFFVGRKTAHDETLRAAEILIDRGIVPRLQIYLNKIGIGTIDQFLLEYERTGVTASIE